ncbi:histidine kinase 3-like isoform X2 [Aristolochia californica]|uniref:histidine kinase 3-like isoform X2 n=1 Tax=Aristolochia californica TaxID=171875 RepID=UPI0035D9F2A9
MALNCETSSSSNCHSMNSNVKEQLRSSNGWKWRRRSRVSWILFCIVVFVWLSCNTVNPKISFKEERTEAVFQEKAWILREHLNISINQADTLTSLMSASDLAFPECLEKAAMRMELNKKLKEQYGELIRSVEHSDTCLMQHKYIYEELGLSCAEDSLLNSSHFMSCAIAGDVVSDKEDQKNSRIGTHVKCNEEYKEKHPMLLFQICGWVLVGMAVHCQISCCHGCKKHQNAQQQQLPSSKGCRTGRWRRKLLILWVLSGVIGSMWIFWTMNENIVLRRREMLANMCDERARMLQDQFNVSMKHVRALAILISTFHHGKHPSAIDQKTFAEYTARTAFERPLTSGVAYALKVLHSEREQFEKEHGFTIKKMEADQSPVQDEYIPENLDQAPVQNEYAPVILSQETVSHIVSIDMMSGKEDRDNVLRARASGKGVLTSPFKLLKYNHLGVVLTFAVYNANLPSDVTQEERIKATQGYLGASFDFISLVEKLLHQLASKQNIVVNVYDTTNASTPIKMYGPYPSDTGLWHLSNLDFGDPSRKHEMHCRFKQKPPLPWSAITTALGVLVIALLIGHIFHAALNRIAEVEDDYREMMELKVRAEAADVAKSQFLATVSHEIRTPMVGVLVLDQAKIESGRLELEAVPFDLRTILDNVLSLFSDKSQEKGIELAVYVSDWLPELVTGDPGRFRQIITNLVGNSIKFTEKGHILVSVHMLNEVKGFSEFTNSVLEQHPEFAKNGISCTSYNTVSGYPVADRLRSWENFKLSEIVNLSEETGRFTLLVMVEDTGVGIPREAQGRIFMPFMQADSSTSRNYGGTGIGLSISKCLVDLMGGEIGFVSEPGVGSTFAFTAAFTKGQISSVDVKRSQNDLVGLEFKGMRALVVDGRPARGQVTKYHLERLGIHVDIAISQISAYTAISNSCSSSAINCLDMVLIDKDAWGKGTGLLFPRLFKDMQHNGTANLLENFPKMFLLSESEEFKLGLYVDNVIKKPLRLSMMVACLHKGLGVVKKNQVTEPLTPQNLLSGNHILVVDDNIVNQRVAAGALKKYGAEVTCAASGKVAVEMLKPPHKFDACFLDVQMPEMDGFEATRRIRLVEKELNEEKKFVQASEEFHSRRIHWHVPILAMTADVTQATHEECVRCGMDGYVSKPFEEEHLYNAVTRFFKSDVADRS